MKNTEGRLQYNRETGVIYFFDSQGACQLRIQGVPPVRDGHQIDIHLVQPGAEHHHGDKEWDDGAICAVRLPRLAKKI